MADIEAFVWHDLNGNITAVGHLVRGDNDTKVAEPIAGQGRRVLKAIVPKDGLADLHLTHVIDCDNQRLVRRPSDGGRRSK
jgi:hypothetical protein